MTKNSKVCFYLTTLLCLVFGVWSMKLGITGHIETSRNRKSCTEKTSAKVVGIENKEVRTGKHSRITVYRAGLKIPNRSYILVSAWSDKKFTENSTIELLYDPSSPDNIYIPANPPYAERKARSYIISGAVFFVLPILLFLSQKQRQEQERKTDQ